VLDLIRLAEDRWLARAVATRRDGTTAVLEEVFVCRGVPHVEAVIDLRDDRAYLVLRERHDPDHVLARQSVEPERTPLRVVWDATRHAAGVRPTPTGPPVPA
jgi:hypothetical protein